jgi:GGDEF domain-containing protein
MDGIVIALAAAAALLALVAGVVAVRAELRARRYGAALHELESSLRPISERIRGAVERARPTADEPASAPAPNLEELLERIAADGSAIVALRQIADEVSPESGARRRPAFRGNRSEYEAELEREIARARRTGRSLSLVLVDVDQATPDRLLQLAAVLARVPRVTDTVCRRRRDAFGILLPETATEGARRFRDRLQAEAAKSFTASGRTTFSTGFVEWRPNESGEALDARARAALESDAAGPDGIAADSPA